MRTAILNATTVDRKLKVKVKTEPGNGRIFSSSGSNSWKSCSFCQGIHTIYRCQHLASKNVNARREGALAIVLHLPQVNP